MKTQATTLAALMVLAGSATASESNALRQAHYSQLPEHILDFDSVWLNPVSMLSRPSQISGVLANEDDAITASGGLWLVDEKQGFGGYINSVDKQLANVNMYSGLWARGKLGIIFDLGYNIDTEPYSRYENGANEDNGVGGTVLLQEEDSYSYTDDTDQVQVTIADNVSRRQNLATSGLIAYQLKERQALLARGFVGFAQDGELELNYDIGGVQQTESFVLKTDRFESTLVRTSENGDKETVKQTYTNAVARYTLGGQLGYYQPIFKQSMLYVDLNAMASYVDGETLESTVTTNQFAANPSNVTSDELTQGGNFSKFDKQLSLSTLVQTQWDLAETVSLKAQYGLWAKGALQDRNHTLTAKRTNETNLIDVGTKLVASDISMEFGYRLGLQSHIQISPKWQYEMDILADGLLQWNKELQYEIALDDANNTNSYSNTNIARIKQRGFVFDALSAEVDASFAFVYRPAEVAEIRAEISQAAILQGIDESLFSSLTASFYF